MVAPQRFTFPIRHTRLAKPQVYPDFVFSIDSPGKRERITVLETKGDFWTTSIPTTSAN